MATFVSPLVADRGGWAKRLTTVDRLGHPPCLLIKVLCWDKPLVNIQTGHKYLHIFCALREVSQHTSSPGLLVINFPVMSFPNPWPSSHTPLAIARESVYNHTYGHFFSSKANSQAQRSKFCMAGDFPFPRLFRGVGLREGLWCRSCPLRWCWPMACRHDRLGFWGEDAERNLVWKGGHWGMAFSLFHHYMWKGHEFSSACWTGQVFLL